MDKISFINGFLIGFAVLFMIWFVYEISTIQKSNPYYITVLAENQECNKGVGDGCLNIFEVDTIKKICDCSDCMGCGKNLEIKVKD